MITESRMREIAGRVVGTYINIDGAYGGQCWDSAMWINRECFGLPVINTGNTATKSGRWPGWAGNLVDCFPQTDAIAAAYELVSPDRPVLPGDTLVWDDSNSVWFPATHVATAVVDTGRGWVLTLSQNSSAARPDLPGYSPHASGPVILQSLPKQGLLGIIRPRENSAGLAYAGTTITEEIDMSAEQNILARFGEVVAWQDAKFSELAARMESDRNALAGWVRDVVNAKDTITAEELDEKFRELTAAQQATGQQLFKGDASPAVYAWDAASGFRHIMPDEFTALVTAGAVLRELPQALIDASPKVG